MKWIDGALVIDYSWPGWYIISALLLSAIALVVYVERRHDNRPPPLDVQPEEQYDGTKDA